VGQPHDGRGTSTLSPPAAIGDDDSVEVLVSVVRVLGVDDQEPFRNAMAAVVEVTDGFEVVGAVGSGEESLVATEELRPDLVLMDVNLPGVDGLEATRLIRQRTDAPIVLLLSTYDEDEFDHRSSGAAAYVPKGAFGPDRLVQEWGAATASER
jgi:DNA-binding NarL/FixJ family response regulator